MSGGLFAKPQSTAKQVEIQFNAGTAATTFFDAQFGSDVPALTGYALVNAGSGSATVTFRNGTATVTTLDIAPGQYQAFFVLGADNIQINATAAGTSTTGDLNVVLNNNPL
ncbi:hypothetical protein DER53_12280 [Parageobacillus toebii NBRC 107807]|jgi:hypothetical protein|uniref:Uncharacterized protein n=2 Tax=Parageobacillus TaxID=1906945 RepID=A0A6G9J5I8_9BACL|nr:MULTISPECIES: S-Ena type endospore appendage [Parageobacillus]MBB3869038.1 hypothetical protein [Parageobacillus toebii NBRC 107807]MED4970361.1 hypothetical protein [Parageobacillus toebii]OXB91661.1 hypothetical protein B9L23_09960 [Parageobacillus galactosidasius]QIQ33449.1 hypothetical protein DER53_12280 [Parageobacillus toebii NBRC 107807]QSB47878.1 hypothetical protein JTI59_12000 [Parageobacillus toebii]